MKLLFIYHWIWRTVRNRNEGKGKKESKLGFCPEEEDVIWLNKISSTELLTEGKEIMCYY